MSSKIIIGVASDKWSKTRFVYVCSVHVWSSVTVTLTFTPKTLSYAPFSVQAVLLRQWCIGIHFSKSSFFSTIEDFGVTRQPKSKEFRLAFWLQQLIKNGNRNTFFRSTIAFEVNTKSQITYVVPLLCRDLTVFLSEEYGQTNNIVATRDNYCDWHIRIPWT